jgi:sugar phosphate isomerase/epimerase
MKLALATLTPEVKAAVPVALLSGTFAERSEKAARLGYDGLELMVLRPNELDVDEMRTQLSKSGLGVAAIASGAMYAVDKLTLLASDAEVSRQAVARLHALIAFAAALPRNPASGGGTPTGFESPLVTIGSFRGRLAWAGGAQARGRLVAILGEAAEKAAQRGVRLVLEPLNRYETDILCTAEETLALIGEVGHSHLGLLLDTFHMNIEEASFGDCLRQTMATGRLWHVHIADSNRLPPGQGHIDFPGVVAVLDETGYQGYLSAELLPRPDPDAAAAATIKHMRRVISEGER